MFHRTGKLCQKGGRRMKCAIWASLGMDRKAQQTAVGKAIEAKLARGDVKEAFLVPQGLVWAVTETAACPCFHTMTMDRQMTERVELYASSSSPAASLPVNVPPAPIPDGQELLGPTKCTNYSTLREKVGSHNDSITAAKEPNYWFKHFHYTSSSLVWCCGSAGKLLHNVCLPIL